MGNRLGLPGAAPATMFRQNISSPTRYQREDSRVWLFSVGGGGKLKTTLIVLNLTILFVVVKCFLKFDINIQINHRAEPNFYLIYYKEIKTCALLILAKTLSHEMSGMCQVCLCPIIHTTDHTSSLMSGWVMTFSGLLVATSQATVSTLWCMDM